MTTNDDMHCLTCVDVKKRNLEVPCCDCPLPLSCGLVFLNWQQKINRKKMCSTCAENCFNGARPGYYCIAWSEAEDGIPQPVNMEHLIKLCPEEYHTLTTIKNRKATRGQMERDDV